MTSLALLHRNDLMWGIQKLQSRREQFCQSKVLISTTLPHSGTHHSVHLSATGVSPNQNTSTVSPTFLSFQMPMSALKVAGRGRRRTDIIASIQYHSVKTLHYEYKSCTENSITCKMPLKCKYRKELIMQNCPFVIAIDNESISYIWML